MMVIVEAVNDLDSKEMEILRDREDNPVKTEQGRVICYHVGKDAYNFLSGKNGRLFEVADMANVNAADIIKSLEELGSKELKKRFLDYMEDVLCYPQTSVSEN